jgi:hypothetical protein
VYEMANVLSLLLKNNLHGNAEHFGFETCQNTGGGGGTTRLGQR